MFVVSSLCAPSLGSVGRRQFVSFDSAQTASGVLGCEGEELHTAVFKHHLRQLLQRATGGSRERSATAESEEGEGRGQGVHTHTHTRTPLSFGALKFDIFCLCGSLKRDIIKDSYVLLLLDRGLLECSSRDLIII